MRYVFGPVFSRRLGLSLGIDIIPYKTCSYDCIYCEVGRTTCKSVDTDSFVDLNELFSEISIALRESDPEVLTFSGSGEPTLNHDLGEMIRRLKGMTEKKIAVLTNGSLLYKEEIREAVRAADILMPTLSTVYEKTFVKIHRPHRNLRVDRVIEGIRRCREEFRGEFQLEVMIVKGINDNEREIGALKKVVDEIGPDRIQLNTVVRPPPTDMDLRVEEERMEDIGKIFGQKAEIISYRGKRRGEAHISDLERKIVEMAKRRPIRVEDIEYLFNGEEEIEDVLEGLIKGKRLWRYRYGENTFFKAI